MSDRRLGFRLPTFWRHPADDAHLSEPADLGTAFGLEMSMLPDDDSTASREPVGMPGGSGWWRRLVGAAG